MRQNVQFSVSQVGRRSATGWPESLSRRGSRLGRTANRWTDGQTGSTELPGKTSAPQGHSKNGLPARWSRSPCPCPSPCSAGPGPQPGRRTSTAGADPASREDGEREDTPPREAVAVGPCGSHRGGGLGGRGGRRVRPGGRCPPALCRGRAASTFGAAWRRWGWRGCCLPSGLCR